MSPTSQEHFTQPDQVDLESPIAHSHPLCPPSTSTSERPDQQLARNTITGVLSFLKRDNDCAKIFLEKEFQDQKHLVEIINGLTIVGAFIAAVQAQIIASTFDKNSTALQIITNGFGFVGLALDISGTSFGIIHALKIQNIISRWPELLQLRDARQNDLLDQLSAEFEGTASAIDHILRELKRELARQRRFWVTRRYSIDDLLDEPFCDHLSILRCGGRITVIALLTLQHFGSFSILISLLNALSKKSRGPADEIGDWAENPMVAIGAGIACLLASIICFAIYSQHRLVWLLCVIFSAMITANMVSTFLAHLMAGQLFRRVGSGRERQSGTEKDHALAVSTLDGMISADPIVLYAYRPGSGF